MDVFSDTHSLVVLLQLNQYSSLLDEFSLFWFSQKSETQQSRSGLMVCSEWEWIKNPYGHGGLTSGPNALSKKILVFLQTFVSLG